MNETVDEWKKYKHRQPCDCRNCRMISDLEEQAKVLKLVCDASAEDVYDEFHETNVGMIAILKRDWLEIRVAAEATLLKEDSV